MSEEESTTPDPVERQRQAVEAFRIRDARATSFTTCFDRDQALADLGLAG